ncbi:MAG: hypothetical protein ABJH72_15945 [Reichenbachiella sp.]
MNKSYIKFFFVGIGLWVNQSLYAQNQMPALLDTVITVPPRPEETSEKDSLASALFEKLRATKLSKSKPDTLGKERTRSKEVVDDYIALHHKQYEDSIVVRWAPSNRALWLKANELGYVLIRRTLPSGNTEKNPITLDQDVSQMSEEQIRELIRAKLAEMHAPVNLSNLEDPIRPYDSAQWVSYFPNEDKYALIAAGATTGSLSISEEEGFAVKGSQDESMFGFVMVAADLSSLAADGLGLRYVDRNVKPGDRYTYEVLLAEPWAETPVDQLTEQQKQQLVKNKMNQRGLVEFSGQGTILEVKDFEAVSKEKSVQLRWPVVENRPFTAYIIERSSDNGATYDSLTLNPYFSETVGILDSVSMDTVRYYVYNNDVEANYIQYKYRITGLDGFGDKSIQATVQGMGSDITAPKNPVLKSGEYLDETGEIRLSWRLPEIPDDFEDLHIEFAYHTDSTFVRLEAESINPRDTVYHYTPLPDEYSHYFRMAMLDTAGNSSYSFPIFVNIPDTIPPPVPTEVHAVVDSTGEVEIKWTDEHVDELGFLGYRLYYSNSPDHEFSQLTTKPIIANFYIYHIPLNTLTEKIYYKVQAVDKSYNHSEFSEIAEAIKPDILRPSTPAFKDIRATEHSIDLFWAPSSSQDVVKQLLFRTHKEETVEIEIDNPTLTTYSDTTVEKGIIYQYRLQAIDDGGLKSELSFPLRGKMIDKKKMDQVSGLSADFDKNDRKVSLDWDYAETEGDYRFIIYRNKDNEKVKSYKTVTQNSTEFSEVLKQPGTYFYAVKVIHKNGSKSQLSEPVKIKIK